MCAQPVRTARRIRESVRNGFRFCKTTTCQLGNLPDALAWLEGAIALAGKKEIRNMALDDPDLEPLWKQLETF